MAQVILDWAEVWALLFPLAAYLFLRNQPTVLRPVLVYIVGAFFINLVCDIIGDFERYLPAWMQTNLLLYNIHSLFRFACFGYFFSLTKQDHFIQFRHTLPFIYFVLVIVNYIYLEDYLDQDHISGNLFTIEAYFLLIYCLLYYLSQLRDDVESFQNDKEFWVVTGLSIYVVSSFFVFLFYAPMIQENPLLAEKMWSVHNLAYILFCLFITKAIYVPVQPNH